ncbi:MULTISPECIES: hypothetical protein [unclassified Helicobacter]|uniref:hypothetical protein n=1 Tax=unclassified Helicobacter TaxID=2593540 RepID=UPI000CF11E5B|nr:MULTISPECIES: hypothetical protein [unclassified Helicobacter]
MHNLAEVCKSHQIQTRIIKCALEVEFSLCENEEKFLEEFHTLYLTYEKSQRWFEALQNKDKGENTVVLEVLMELYKKISSLEKKILKEEEQKLLNLDFKSMILALGHEVVWIESAVFEENKNYYLRFILPTFSDRIIPIFARALSKNALIITKMHPRDIQDFDGYIVAREMEQIRWQKQVRG